MSVGFDRSEWAVAQLVAPNCIPLRRARRTLTAGASNGRQTLAKVICVMDARDTSGHSAEARQHAPRQRRTGRAFFR